ncbi:MAG: type II toxin-antitoxin system VapC family toxin [Acidobacteriota bacterium]
MRVLLDTQCWLWMAAAPERLSARARALLDDADNELLFSSASAWEIAIKHALGRLQLPEPPARYVPSRTTALRTTPLAIEQAHALGAGALPPHHRDPFDRLLIAQAVAERVPIMTTDAVFERYDVRVIDA